MKMRKKKYICGLEMDKYFSTSSLTSEINQIIRMQYPDSVKNKFRAIIVILALFIVALPWLNIFDTGWIQIFVIFDLILVVFYRYRLRRIIEVSEQGISEILGKKKWYWKWNEIEEVRHMIALQTGSMPANRITVEHHSTHDITFDDQMVGWDEALKLIKRIWHNGNKRKIELTSVPFILMKYW